MAELTITQQLVELCQRPINTAARQRAAWHLLDWLGCALAGSRSAVGRELARFQSQQLPGGQCFAAGCAAAGATEAAFVNGGLGNIYELDDVHRMAVLHAGDVVVPAALAMAQQCNASADDLLGAIICGYEVALRIGIAAASGGYTGWYNSGTCGVFGAAMAAGRLHGLSESQQVDALGQAGMSAAGIWQCRLEQTHSKQLACANAARHGVAAAQLASGDFPGATQILEGELGFFASYYPHCDVSMVLREASPWMLFEVSFKPWPACRHAHPAIEALLLLREAIDVSAVSEVRIVSYQAAIDFCHNPRPVNAHEARFSLQHCAAVALLLGAPLIEHFEQSVRDDPAIVSLAARTQVQADVRFNERFPQRYGAAVEVQLADGRTFNAIVDSALGDPENPLTSAALLDKFFILANHAGVDQADALALADCVTELPATPTLAKFNRALAQANGQLAVG